MKHRQQIADLASGVDGRSGINIREGLIFMAASSEGTDPVLAELIEYSAKVAEKKRPSTWRRFIPKPPIDPSKSSLLELGYSEGANFPTDSFAAPLSPLRSRDITALKELFDREDVEELAADVTARLLLLYPEPCWEDDMFSFLREYL